MKSMRLALTSCVQLTKKTRGSHGDGNAHSSKDDARVEVDIWVQAPLDKVLVAGGYMLELHGNL